MRCEFLLILRPMMDVHQLFFRLINDFIAYFGDYGHQCWDTLRVENDPDLGHFWAAIFALKQYLRGNI